MATSVWSPELEELKREWIALPSKCAVEADHLAEDAAKGCAVAVSQGYAKHWVTGRLTRSVRATRFHKGKFQEGWVVKTAPHAHFVERGTKKRFYVTAAKHKIHATGAGGTKTPIDPVMARTAPIFRRQLWDRLKQMLRNQKLTVTGDA